MLTIHEPTFSYFLKVATPNLDWRGKAAREWARLIDPSIDVSRLPLTSLSRSDVRRYCRDDVAREEDVFLVCMAWGGMKYSHGREAWAARRSLLPVIAALRDGRFTRDGGYRKLNDLKIPGLGPAFFTKLLYFLRPLPDAYILDQWTAKSTCLLVKPAFIYFIGDAVGRQTTSYAYELYCSFVEHLSKSLVATGRDVSPEDVEAMMFSSGGRSPHPWRRHVRENWRPFSTALLVDARQLTLPTARALIN